MNDLPLRPMFQELQGHDAFRDCTGDACTGDEIIFIEAVFSGSFRSPKFRGERAIRTRIIKDSYGEVRGQHTFTLEVIAAIGCDAAEVTGKAIRRKGRNVYRNGTMRRLWDDENARRASLDEKHTRGDCARGQKELARVF